MKLVLLKHEIELFNQGYKYIAGVDEVGRGPLAGPLVACAVILDIEKLINEPSRNGNNDVEYQKMDGYKDIKDSKKITEQKRFGISEFIKSKAICYSISQASPQEIDDMGISACVQKVFYQAVRGLKVQSGFILTDFIKIKEIPPDRQLNFTRGEDESLSIAAASIVAKVYRDQYMIKEHETYPKYGFDHHKGYGTKDHYEKLKIHGPCQIHRKSFRLTGEYCI